jgi:hypothetical protein
MSSNVPNLMAYSVRLLLLAVFSCFITATVCAQSKSARQNSGSLEAEKSFATPQQAADALLEAAKSYDVSALLDMFGADGKDLISSGDRVLDKNRAQAFAAKAQEKKLVVIDPKNRSRAILLVGNDEFPLPVPSRGMMRFSSAASGPTNSTQSRSVAAS